MLILFRPVTVGGPSCISWSPKGKQLAVGTDTGAIIRIDQTGKTVFIIPANSRDPPASTLLAYLADLFKYSRSDWYFA